MDKEQIDKKEFLKQQIHWTKNQIRVLDEMDIKLQEMKKIAEYAAENKLSASETEDLNSQLNALKNEYFYLEAKRHTKFH